MSWLLNYNTCNSSNNSYLEYSLFDEFLNIGNHCVEFVYETILYLYSGSFYEDLTWLESEYRAIGLDYVASLLPILKIGLFYIQSFIITFDGAYSTYFPIDWFVSDTHIMHATIAQCPGYIIRYYPEILDYSTDDQFKYFFSLSMPMKFLLRVENMEVVDSFVSGYVLYISTLLFIFYLSLVYMSLGQKYNKDESSVDGEYLNTSSLVESEKEIGSFDDGIFFFFNIIYLFGWFFGTYFYLIVSRLPELIFFLYAIPGIFYIALSIPTYLSYDYGLIYGCYLRGTGGTASLIYELGYDYIAIAVFYIRLILQGIRLLIMIVTYASFHDYMLFYNINPSSFMSPSDLFVNKFNYNFVQANLYYLFICVPSLIIYFAYEIIHLYFVITSQTVAFFAIIFWLFLFLYTFFFAARIEKFFLIKRALRKELWKDIYTK